jgi:inorganic pyrophosphatase
MLGRADSNNIPAGTHLPTSVNAIIEIPKGRRTKFELDKQTGLIRMDRYLYSSSHYPGDYGFIPQTLAEDNDPLDILVMVNEPSFPGCIVEARPIGLFRMVDKGLNDDKVLAVPETDPLFQDYHDLADVPRHFLAEVAHFFKVYKDLEGVRVKPLGWDSAKAAQEAILHAVELYREKYR